MKITDIRNMPNYSSKASNGIDSVSRDLVVLETNIYALTYPACIVHGAMNAVSENCRIWRCLMCHVGAYLEER
jgi:hypothetical protein